MIKGHKSPNENDIFPTILVMPATNFPSVFPKIGGIGIKEVLDSNSTNYQQRTIVQASNLKRNLGKVDLKKNECTIFR